MSAAHPLPLPLAAHTVESLRAEHGRVPRAIYWLTLAGTVAALISLPLIEVDVSVSAPGVVRPATERVDLRLALGGRVARVLAHDNDRVAAGQPLLELATPDLDERLARNAALQREKQAVRALLDSLSTARLVSSGVLYDVTGRRAVEPSSSLQAIGQEVEQLRAQLEAGRVGEAKARSELARATALADKGIATQRELDDARYALERVQAEARLAVEQMRTHWHDRRQETAAALADLASEQKRLEAERAQAVLRAPLAGTVQGLVGFGAGAIVGAGQVVGAISPDDRLVVETHVPPHEIGLVRPGQPVRLQIDAFPYTQWGLLDARVVAIAARHGGVKLDNSVPRVMRSRPFGPVRGMLGRDGERWVPIHAVFPLSEARRVLDANDAFFAAQKAEMDAQGIVYSVMTMTTGNEFFLEPAFYWMDEITPLHAASLGEDVVRPWRNRPANVAAREAVVRLRSGTQQMYAGLGGVSWQVARDYPYRDLLQPGTRAMLVAMKRALDPRGLMNPGSLGLPA